jgi:hypothetical protein
LAVVERATNWPPTRYQLLCGDGGVSEGATVASRGVNVWLPEAKGDADSVVSVE